MSNRVEAVQQSVLTQLGLTPWRRRSTLSYSDPKAPLLPCQSEHIRCAGHCLLILGACFPLSPPRYNAVLVEHVVAWLGTGARALFFNQAADVSQWRDAIHQHTASVVLIADHTVAAQYVGQSLTEGELFCQSDTGTAVMALPALMTWSQPGVKSALWRCIAKSADLGQTP